METACDPLDAIDAEIKAFDEDHETRLTEATVRELIETYPSNVDVRHVLVKVITINCFYHARVLDVDLQPMAEHILKIAALDSALKEGSPDAVHAIWKSQGTRKHYFSFATKFCSWHNQQAYSIYDSYVWEALAAYRRTKDPRFTFRDAESDDYIGFLSVVRRFQKAYGLGHYSLKDIDKFLWSVGYRIVASRPVIVPPESTTAG